MSEREFLTAANELLHKIDKKSDKLDKRNNRAWAVISLLGIFFLGSMGTGIYKMGVLESTKADKTTLENMYLKIERYESGQLMKSKLESAYMAKMAALAGGDSLEISKAKTEYNYHIREIIKFAGTRSINKN